MKMISLIAGILLTISLGIEHGQKRAAIEKLSADKLKEYYLDCEKMASEVVLGGSDVAIFSTLYDILLNKAFAGDFSKLIVW